MSRGGPGSRDRMTASVKAGLYSEVNEPERRKNW